MNNQISELLARKARNLFFPGSSAYWERRYQRGGNSGKGSYGKNATYKAEIINRFVSDNNIERVIELGCGDGNQLMQFQFPAYTGLDVSATAIERCIHIFKEDRTKRFFLYNEDNLRKQGPAFDAQLSLSLDVIFHLVERDVFEKYMHALFTVSSRYVIIYGWDVVGKQKYHVMHRRFSDWIAHNIPGFHLKDKVVDLSGNKFCDFFVYEKL